jgi:hypothetical protein
VYRLMKAGVGRVGSLFGFGIFERTPDLPTHFLSSRRRRIEPPDGSAKRLDGDTLTQLQSAWEESAWLLPASRSV